MDGGAWWAAVCGVAKSWTRMNDFTFTFHFHALEKEMATHSSVLAWRIPGTGEPGGLTSMGSHRVGHNWSDLAKDKERIKPMNIQQRKVRGPEWEPQVKHTALLASPVYIAQGEKKKHIKRGATTEPLSSCLVSWVGPHSCLEDVFSFACQIKLSCNWTVILVHCFKFLLWRDRTGEFTHSPDTSKFIL